jgi:hypothetical protein
MFSFDFCDSIHCIIIDQTGARVPDLRVRHERLQPQGDQLSAQVAELDYLVPDLLINSVCHAREWKIGF